MVQYPCQNPGCTLEPGYCLANCKKLQKDSGVQVQAPNRHDCVFAKAFSYTLTDKHFRGGRGGNLYFAPQDKACHHYFKRPPLFNASLIGNTSTFKKINISMRGPF